LAFCYLFSNGNYYLYIYISKYMNEC
jgi:hypothetical protein